VSSAAPKSLGFLTWNLANLAPSAQAPASWSLADSRRELATKVRALKPDVVTVQEADRLDRIEGYTTVGSVRSHAGKLATLVADDYLASCSDEPVVLELDGFAVLTTLAVAAPPSSDTPDHGDLVPLTVANVHLEPYASGSDIRTGQLAAVVHASPTKALAAVGDTNARVAEMATFKRLGLMSPKPPSPTWDSFGNQFHDQGRPFRTYFTRALTSKGVALDDQQVWNHPLTRSGHRFHLSDHFALSGTLTLA